jgi:hypothetical protein
VGERRHATSIRSNSVRFGIYGSSDEPLGAADVATEMGERIVRL